MRTNVCMLVRLREYGFVLRLTNASASALVRMHVCLIVIIIHLSVAFCSRPLQLDQAHFYPYLIEYLLRLLSLATRKSWPALLRRRAISCIREAPIRKQVTPPGYLRRPSLAWAHPETNKAEELVWTSIRGAAWLLVRPVSPLSRRASQLLRCFRSVF